MAKITEENRKAAEYWLNSAHKRLKAARLSVELKSSETVLDRSFFAAFDTARALLLTIGRDSKDHDVVLSRFIEYFVETGEVPDKMGGILADLTDLQYRALFEDYFEISMEDAVVKMNDAKEFAAIATEAVNRILEDTG